MIVGDNLHGDRISNKKGGR